MMEIIYLYTHVVTFLGIKLDTGHRDDTDKHQCQNFERFAKRLTARPVAWLNAFHKPYKPAGFEMGPVFVSNDATMLRNNPGIITTATTITASRLVTATGALFYLTQ